MERDPPTRGSSLILLQTTSVLVFAGVEASGFFFGLFSITSANTLKKKKRKKNKTTKLTVEHKQGKQTL